VTPSGIVCLIRTAIARSSTIAGPSQYCAPASSWKSSEVSG
jgi:hypothetical protein